MNRSPYSGRSLDLNIDAANPVPGAIEQPDSYTEC